MVRLTDRLDMTIDVNRECVSDMGFTAHQHKKAISRRIRYKIIRQICRKS